MVLNPATTHKKRGPGNFGGKGEWFSVRWGQRTLVNKGAKRHPIEFGRAEKCQARNDHKSKKYQGS